MSVPKKKRTSSAKKRRSSHFALKKINLHTCPKCKSHKLAHRVCPKCGVYKGNQVLTTKL